MTEQVETARVETARVETARIETGRCFCGAIAEMWGEPFWICFDHDEDRRIDGHSRPRDPTLGDRGERR